MKKIKFRKGKDADQMLIRKLVTNFFSKGKLKTTLKKAKVLKSVVEKLVEKTKERTEANFHYLLRYLTDKNLFPLLFDHVGPTLKDKKGGYVRVVRLGKRDSDGAEIARLEWAYPIVIEDSVKKASKKEKTETKETTKPESESKTTEKVEKSSSTKVTEDKKVTKK